MEKASQAEKPHLPFQTLCLAEPQLSPARHPLVPCLGRLLRGLPECVWAHTLQGGKERGCQSPSSECQGPLDTQHEDTLENEGHRSFLFHKHHFTYHKTILLLLPHLIAIAELHNSKYFDFELKHIKHKLITINYCPSSCSSPALHILMPFCMSPQLCFAVPSTTSSCNIFFQKRIPVIWGAFFCTHSKMWCPLLPRPSDHCPGDQQSHCLHGNDGSSCSLIGLFVPTWYFFPHSLTVLALVFPCIY